MSRFCGETDVEPILNAASYWRDVAFLQDGSVFSDKSLWNIDGLRAFETHFTKNPDEGEGKFWEKLRGQLELTDPAVEQLAAEMNWFMLLCPSNISVAKKRGDVNNVWEWSGETVPQRGERYLRDEVLAGVGSAGPGFNNHRWLELAYFIRLSLAFKQLPAIERQTLLSDGWKFAEWLQKIPGSESRQLRHMLLFLLFPDSFERIFGRNDRRAVAQTFGGVSSQVINTMNPVELDKTLLRIRGELESKYGKAELDYYEPPLDGLWKQPDFKIVTQDITRDHVLSALGEIDRNGIPADAESTGYDLLYLTKRYPPKLVVSLATKYALGSEYDRSIFGGGENSPAFRLLRDLGFEIVPKALIDELIDQFISQAGSGASLKVSSYPKSYRHLEISVSFGKGGFARIPWIAFLGPGQQVSNGVYPVILFYRELNLLILAYGVSETHDARTSWGNLGQVKSIRQFIQEGYGREPERYGDSFVCEALKLEHGLDRERLTKALDGMIDGYKPIFQDLHQPEAEYSSVDQAARYSIDDALKGLFIPRDTFANMVERLHHKRNVILQGPPGVGKTFVAKRLAYALMEAQDSLRVGMVQFHPAYSYEDFVQGYRPSGTGFQLKNGIFFEFCRQARSDLDHKYVFIIDEVNRANLSKVFGELMMLIERDKRKKEYAVPLAYADKDDENFFVPDNLYVIGLMNTADRSLAMVDYALRRRFAFIDVEPAFGTEEFSEFMREAGATEELIRKIVLDMEALNDEIRRDKTNLGSGFCIGHSYFCPLFEGSQELTLNWYQDVIRSEILPLLSEYWFDAPDKLEDWKRRLLEG